MTARSLLIGAAASLALASSASAAPSITLSSPSAHRGDFITVTGRGWTPSTHGNGMFLGVVPKRTSLTRYALHLGNATVSARGRFTFTFKVTRFIKPGRWTVKARQADTRRRATFRVLRD